MRMRPAILVLIAIGLMMFFRAESTRGESQDSTERALLHRNYEEGERLSYRMVASNRGRLTTTTYEATARGIVRRDDGGRLFEEYQWSRVVRNGTEVELPPASREFRQVLSLSADYTLSIPDLSKIHPALMGPVLDLLTFYADLWLAMQQPGLGRAGDQILIAHGEPNSWADGTRVLLGEDAIDFDITLSQVETSEGTATVLVRHVPPRETRIEIPADWMREPVTEVVDNWVQVMHTGDGQYVASIGTETFDVTIQLDLGSGRIISARMYNPVEVLERQCTDAALTNCDEGVRYQILRQIEIYEDR